MFFSLSLHLYHSNQLPKASKLYTLPHISLFLFLSFFFFTPNLPLSPLPLTPPLLHPKPQRSSVQRSYPTFAAATQPRPHPHKGCDLCSFAAKQGIGQKRQTPHTPTRRKEAGEAGKGSAAQGLLLLGMAGCGKQRCSSLRGLAEWIMTVGSWIHRLRFVQAQALRQWKTVFWVHALC